VALRATLGGRDRFADRLQVTAAIQRGEVDGGDAAHLDEVQRQLADDGGAAGFRLEVQVREIAALEIERDPELGSAAGPRKLPVPEAAIKAILKGLRGPLGFQTNSAGCSPCESRSTRSLIMPSLAVSAAPPRLVPYGAGANRKGVQELP